MGSIYNGKYYVRIGVNVKARDHKTCIDTYNMIKNLCKAWELLGIQTHESKTGRSGPILGRDIQIYFSAYAHDVITFRESLNCIVRQIKIFGKNVSVCIYFNETVREDASPNTI